MSVLVLSHLALNLVAALLIAQLSEGVHVHVSRDGSTDQEESECSERPSSERSYIKEGAAGCSAHEDHGGEAPEEASLEVVAAIAVGVEGYSVASLLVLIQLQSQLTLEMLTFLGSLKLA